MILLIFFLFVFLFIWTKILRKQRHCIAIYLSRHFVRSENPRETSTAANDAPAGAQVDVEQNREQCSSSMLVWSTSDCKGVFPFPAELEEESKHGLSLYCKEAYSKSQWTKRSVHQASDGLHVVVGGQAACCHKDQTRARKCPVWMCISH